jgi:glycine/D-amino acid oxidase-like deaminating enzyme/nitrite reductase/ring-hydroxylating ferredoxin subunit
MRDRSIPNDSGHSISTWMDLEVPSFDGVEVPNHADVCVVGAGIAGLSVAYELAQQGVHVTVIDDGPIGGGETARTTAHLASALDDRFSLLEERFGADGARLAAESHAAAIDSIEANVRELGIDCQFRRVDGYLFVPPGGSLELLDRELEAARRAGLVVERTAQAPLPFDTGPCLRFANQGEIHPVAYIRGLAQAIVARGGHIHTGVHVAGLEKGDPIAVHLAGGSVLRANVVIDATNATISSMVKLPIRQAAYRSYVLAFDQTEGDVPHALYWDTADPYHYLRVARGEHGREILIAGGEDHRTGQDSDPAQHWARLEAWVRERFPDAGAVRARWSGQIMEPADGLAFIGKSPDLDHVFIVTGDSGNGMTHGALAGLLLPDLLRGREHPWERIYDPHRTRLRGLGTLIREAASSSVPYTDWLRRGDVGSIDDLGPGQGAVIRHGLHMIAAFRDEGGTCHQRSAKCPHLGGVVHWNGAEQTWDCPCHGSRFDALGRVLNGPAISDLEPVEAPAAEAPEKKTEAA